MLVVFAGLPGTGKTTLSLALARRYAAVHLRIDIIEQAIRASGSEVGTAGYAVGQALAEANLALGLTVVADCVKPVQASRAGWRVAGRFADIPGLVLPDWEQVLSRAWDPGTDAHLAIDTAAMGVEVAIRQVTDRMAACRAAVSG